MFLHHYFKQYFHCLLIFVLAACNSAPTINTEKLSLGVIGYGEGAVSIEKYEKLQQYLAKSTSSIVELEPAYNELQALDQINRQNWSIVFAPPGLAAVAIAEKMYLPIFPLAGISSTERSVFVVPTDSKINSLQQLTNQNIALGKPGSAAGYYLPLYDLYGLTLGKIHLAATPKQVLQLISTGEVEAGALSESEFERYREQFPNTSFRIVHKSRWIPSGVVLISPTVERNQQENIQTVMREAPSEIVSDAGYVPGANIPDYQELIKLVKKVQPLESQVRQVPAVLIVPQPPKN